MRFAFAETIRQLLAQLLDVGQPTPHQALDRTDGIEGIARRGKLGLRTHLNMIRVITHDRRQNHLSFGVGQRRSDTTAQRSHEGIGGAQVYSYSQAALMRLWALSWLGNLK